MTPRVGLLGFFHEANSFVDSQVDASTIASAELVGDQIRTVYAGTSTVMGGYLAAIDEYDIDAILLRFCELVPSGPLTAEAAERVESMLVTALCESAHLDILLVCLHGAAAANGDDDLDRRLLAAIRRAVGPDTVVVVTLDLHANLTTTMVKTADFITGFRTNPHVDAKERALEAAAVAVEIHRTRIRPTPALVAVPMLVGILNQGTADGALAVLMDIVGDAIEDPEVVGANLFVGFSWADSPHLALTSLVWTDSDAQIAARWAEHIATAAWNSRHALNGRGVSLDQAFHSLGNGSTTLLLDVGDNIGGGGPGDRTDLFAAAVDRDIASVVAIIRDPELASAAHRAGPGGAIEGFVGDPALAVAGTVCAVSDGRYEDRGVTHVGYRNFVAGPSAAIDLGNGRRLVVCSERIMPSSIVQLTSLGIHPGDADFVCAKGVQSPLASYRSHVDSVRFVETPGPTRIDVQNLPYTRRPRPLYPIDDVTTTPDLTPRELS